MAARRTVRDGAKGSLWVADILFANGKVVWSDLQQGMSKAMRLKLITKVRFSRMFAREQILRARGASFRKRFKPHHVACTPIKKAPRKRKAPAPTPAAPSPPTAPAHQLLDMGQERRRQAQEAAGSDGRRAANRPGRRGSSHGGSKAKCAHKGCAIGKPKRPQTHCAGCNRYFHLPCFRDMHAPSSGLRAGVTLRGRGEGSGGESEEEDGEEGD